MTVSLPKTTSRHVTSLSHYVPPAAVRGNHVYVDWFPSTHTVGVTYAAFGLLTPRTRGWVSGSAKLSSQF